MEMERFLCMTNYPYLSLMPRYLPHQRWVEVQISWQFCWAKDPVLHCQEKRPSILLEEQSLHRINCVPSLDHQMYILYCAKFTNCTNMIKHH